MSDYFNKPGYDTYSFWDHFDSHLMRPKFISRNSPSFYPSEASVHYTDKFGDQVVEGGCLRASYYRLKKLEGKAYDPRALLIFDAGISLEQMIVNTSKEMGVWVDNNHRFSIDELGFPLHGELDIILYQPDIRVNYGVECLTKDSLCLLEDGSLEPIGSMTLAKKVIGDSMTPNKIECYTAKAVQDEVVYRPRGDFDGFFTEFTGKHPLLTAKIENNEVIEKWTLAEDLKEGDLLCIPKAKFGNETHGYNKFVIDFLHILLGLAISEDVYEFNDSKDTMTFHLFSTDLPSSRFFKLASQVELSFDIKTKLEEHEDGSFTFTFISETFKSLFNKFFIKADSYDDVILNYENLHVDSIFNTAFFSVHDNSLSSFTCKTSNPNIAYLYFQIFAHLNCSPKIVNLNGVYTIAVSHDILMMNLWAQQIEPVVIDSMNNLIDYKDYWLAPVTDVSTRKYTGAVYNLEVTPSHTFVAGLFLTHNCKSFYGYESTKQICGNTKQKGFPKWSQLLQTIMYTYLFRPGHGFNFTNLELEFFRMFYIARDDPSNRAQFKVEVEQEGDSFYPKVDGEVIKLFTVEDIFRRYRTLQEYLENDELPPRDYELNYSEEKVLDFHKKGKLSDNKLKDFQSNQRVRAGKSRMKNPYIKNVGDWQCSYCKYKDECYKKANI